MELLPLSALGVPWISADYNEELPDSSQNNSSQKSGIVTFPPATAISETSGASSHDEVLVPVPNTGVAQTLPTITTIPRAPSHKILLSGPRISEEGQSFVRKCILNDGAPLKYLLAHSLESMYMAPLAVPRFRSIYPSEHPFDPNEEQPPDLIIEDGRTLRDAMLCVIRFCQTRNPECLERLGRDNFHQEMVNDSLLARVIETNNIYINSLRFDKHPILHFLMLQGHNWMEVSRWMRVGADPLTADTEWTLQSIRMQSTRPRLRHGTLLECAVYHIAATGEWRGRWIACELIKAGYCLLGDDQNHRNLQEYIRAHITALPSEPRHRYDFARTELTNVLRVITT